jgi:hypothetical protein
MSELITVKAAPDFLRVALWERNPAHPGGEAFVAGDMVVQVALTAEVQTRLNTGILVRVDDAPPSLPFEGYDSLSVADILERMAGMGDTELLVVRQYESANQGRAEILGTPDTPGAVVEPEPPTAPFEGYDSLSAAAVIERLADLSEAERAAIRLYETAHKNRKTVLEALA